MRGFTGDHKVNLWNEKFRTLLAEEALTDKEKNHLRKLFSFIKPEHYDTKSGFAELKSFVEKWKNEAETNLAWGEKEFFLYTSILFTVPEFNEYIVSERQKYMQDDSDCECIYSIYCEFRNHTTCDETSGCHTSDGCGIVGTSNCTGRCE